MVGGEEEVSPYHVEIEFHPCRHRALFLADEYDQLPLVCGECLEPVLEVFDA